MVYSYEYPRPMVAVDILVLRKFNESSFILLIKRLNQPYVDQWAMPGGFVDKDESLIDAANRELFEETGLNGLKLRQFKAFGDPGRDPRGHSVSIVFIAEIEAELIELKAGDDAKDAEWFNINNLPPLAFDHELIIEKALKSVRL
ncbi:MAG: NUDIX hydrolase [Salinivirgaceae bacterium]|jgi:8-oxo-dGTP diphosphatase|nr:NUDIX hydrolase [Salinivirgaceae bacterium]